MMAAALIEVISHDVTKLVNVARRDESRAGVIESRAGVIESRAGVIENDAGVICRAGSL